MSQQLIHSNIELANKILNYFSKEKACAGVELEPYANGKAFYITRDRVYVIDPVTKRNFINTSYTNCYLANTMSCLAHIVAEMDTATGKEAY